MSEHSAAATTLPHRGIRGSVTVGDYLDAPAAAAVRAVRRVALCPGLDRQFGGEPQSIGLVVAQDPQPGSEVARGAIVTLYVSAPAAGAEPGGQCSAASEAPERAVAAALRQEIEPECGAAPEVGPNARPARVRRKRRGGPAARSGGGQPAVPMAGAGPQADMLGERDIQHAPAGEDTPLGEHEHEASTAEPDPAWDQLSFEMRNVFQAGALGLGRRRVYPRKPLSLRMRTCSRWLRAHKALALAAVALMALAMSFAATREQPANRTNAEPAARTAAGVPPISSRRRAPAARSRPPRRVQTAREYRRARRARRSRPRRSARAPATSPTPGVPVGALHETPSQTSAAASAPSSQSGGGPFSP